MGVRAQHPGEARQEWCAGRHGDWELRDNRCAAIRRLGSTRGVWLTAALLGNRPQLLVEHVPDRQPGIRGRGLHHPRASSSPPPTNKKSRVRMSVS